VNRKQLQQATGVIPVDREFVTAMLERQQRTESDAARLELVCNLIAQVTSDEAARLVWDAYSWGQLNGMERVRSQHVRELRRGKASVLGEWKAKAKAADEQEARRVRARPIYRETLAEFPNEDHQTQCGIVAERCKRAGDKKATARVVAKWFPSAIPPKRGRPTKN
jgi:hypothetical protein